MLGPEAVPWEQVLVLAHQPQLPVGAVVQVEQEVQLEQPLPAGAYVIGAAVGWTGQLPETQSQLPVAQKPADGPDEVPSEHLAVAEHHPQLPLDAMVQE